MRMCLSRVGFEIVGVGLGPQKVARGWHEGEQCGQMWCEEI